MKKTLRSSLSRPLARLLLAASLVAAASLAQAQTAVRIGDAHARGVSVLGVETLAHGTGYTVSARVKRSRMSGVLAPVVLKVVLRDAAGAIRAESATRLGPAELPRRRMRSFRFDSEIDVVPAAGDSVEIRLEG